MVPPLPHQVSSISSRQPYCHERVSLYKSGVPCQFLLVSISLTRKANPVHTTNCEWGRAKEIEQWVNLGLLQMATSTSSLTQCPPLGFGAKYYHVSPDGGSCVRDSSYFGGKPVLNQGVGYSVVLGFGAFFAVFTSFLVHRRFSPHLLCSAATSRKRRSSCHTDISGQSSAKQSPVIDPFLVLWFLRFSGSYNLGCRIRQSKESRIYPLFCNWFCRWIGLEKSTMEYWCLCFSWISIFSIALSMNGRRGLICLRYSLVFNRIYLLWIFLGPCICGREQASLFHWFIQFGPNLFPSPCKFTERTQVPSFEAILRHHSYRYWYKVQNVDLGGPFLY